MDIRADGVEVELAGRIGREAVEIGQRLARLPQLLVVGLELLLGDGAREEGLGREEDDIRLDLAQHLIVAAELDAEGQLAALALDVLLIDGGRHHVGREVLPQEGAVAGHDVLHQETHADNDNLDVFVRLHADPLSLIRNEKSSDGGLPLHRSA